ncbi:MAG: serine/threonine protein kinase, partial [Myxococcales bacterium]|nr:serine/threonine protein kinase [Myxococcales bacterium]
MSGPRATSDEFADRLMDARERGPVVEAERVLAAVSKRLFGTDSEPVKIGRFVIIRRLGAGAMGVVYQGHDPELDRKVAIKLVGMVATDPRARRRSATRTLREAQALARVQHPNAIAVHEVGTHDDQVFIAMEYVEGPTLAQWQRAAPRSWREVAALYLQAGRGLQAAHAAGLVHRDFKPENVLVGQDGAGPGGLRVRVVDFGLARVVSESGATPDGAVAAAADAGGRSGDEESGRAVEGEHDSASSGAADEHPVSATLVSQAQGPENSALAGELAGDERARSLPDGFALHANLTATGALVGTPAYMAPEQFTGSQADVRSDQWSFTAALYEGLFGARPFRDVPLPERARTIARGLPPAPARPKLPRSVRRILERGLQARPEERFPSMRALLDELERALRPPRWGLLALTGASAVAVTIAALQLSASASRCDGAEEALATAWTRDRAAAAERAFLATGRPYAARTWALTSATLDEHAAAWTTMWTEACAATHIRGDQSPVALDLRMRCLDRRRAELAALVDVFIEADADVVDRAAQASAGLTPVDGCADVEALAAPQPVPDDPRI